MPNRIDRINSLIKKSLAGIILKEIDFPLGILPIITNVETSVDLISVKVYILVLPEEKNKQILKILNQSVYKIKKVLNKKLRIRPVSEIKFIEDKETKNFSRIEELLEKIKSEENI